MSASPEDRPKPGQKLLFRWRKWDGGVHWVHECIYLGADEYGDWLGQLPGWRSVRPGRDSTPVVPNVTLVPHEPNWVYTHNAAPHRTRVYIDIAWDVTWTDGLPTAIDMDLDVVERDDLGVYIDDEDEWAEHRVAYGYPHYVQRTLEALADDLHRRVSDRDAPFDTDTGVVWLDRLAEMTAGEPRFDADDAPAASA